MIPHLPGTLRIGAFDFTVKYWPGKSSDNDGLCDVENFTIWFKPEQYGPGAVDSVLHEVGHAIYWAYGLGDGDAEERLVTVQARVDAGVPGQSGAAGLFDDDAGETETVTSTLLIWLVTGLYVLQAGICFLNGQGAQGVILSGYSLANLGLIWTMK